MNANAETIRALKELELYSRIVDNLQFLLASIIHTSNKGHVLANITVEDIKKRLEEILEQFKKVTDVKTAESVAELLEELDKPDDTELLDFLQELTNKAEYTGKAVCRDSTTGRGWRLYESGHVDAIANVREAIISYMKTKRKEQNDG